MAEFGLEFIDYLKVLQKKKWFIILGTLFCVVFVLIISLFMQPVYEIDAIIQPGKLILKNPSGNISEYVIEDGQQIANKVEHETYDSLIAAELNLPESELPKLKAEKIRNTMLTRLWIMSSNVELSRKVLESLIGHIKINIDEKVRIELSTLDSEIALEEIEKERRTKEIEILNSKVSVLNQRKNDIIKEMALIKTKIDELEKEQLRALKTEEKSELESLGLLLYSNEIQQSLMYHETLNEKLSRIKLEAGTIRSQIQVEYAKIHESENSIVNLKERKGRIDFTKIIKNPSPSRNPVFPNKKLNVFIAGIFGLMIFTIIAFLLEYMAAHKLKE